MSVNKVVLLGRVGKKPMLQETAKGKVYTFFSVATNKKFKDTEQTQWHFVTVWDKLAELCERYLFAGAQVYIEGELRYREIMTEQGKKANQCSINANVVKFLSKAKDEANGNSMEYEDPNDVPF